jgi:hypothetical protein
MKGTNLFRFYHRSLVSVQLAIMFAIGAITSLKRLTVLGTSKSETNTRLIGIGLTPTGTNIMGHGDSIS